MEKSLKIFQKLIANIFDKRETIISWIWGSVAGEFNWQNLSKEIFQKIQFQKMANMIDKRGTIANLIWGSAADK